MRSFYRTLGPALTRDIALVCLADAVVGASYGAISVSAGFDPWLPILASLLVFAGASQFLLVGIVGAGGSIVAAVLAGLLVNARHLPFGMSVRDALGRRTAGRLLGSHVMTDETVAFTVAQADPGRRRATYWICGLGLFACWNLAVAAGAFAGRAIRDTDALGLDAAFPAVLLALVLPALRDAATRRASAIGVMVALATSLFLPAGLPVLLALVGVAAVRPLRREGAA